MCVRVTWRMPLGLITVEFSVCCIWVRKSTNKFLCKTGLQKAFSYLCETKCIRYVVFLKDVCQKIYVQNIFFKQIQCESKCSRNFYLQLGSFVLTNTYSQQNVQLVLKNSCLFPVSVENTIYKILVISASKPVSCYGQMGAKNCFNKDFAEMCKMI